MTENQRIVNSANELARQFSDLEGYCAPNGFKFYESQYPLRYNRYWRMAVVAYAHITATDVDDCLTEYLEEES
jgi:hypothetical protein